MIQQPVIDRSVLQELYEFCGEEALIALVGTFLQHAPQQMTQIESSLQSGDCAKISSTVHTFRSGAGSLGLLRLCPLAAQLEDSADAEDLAGVNGLVPQLRKEFDVAVNELEAIQRDPSTIATHSQ